ncbi:hypothetical protein Fot_21889 [Forsythia ovata]|uniref:Uncharacterized protein n=1 Tax=Forsythia ovata TaxID=205694 RepID=A0ABD1UW55_9LAMI
MSAYCMQSLVQKHETRAKQSEKKTIKMKDKSSNYSTITITWASSKRSLSDEDDFEVLEEEKITLKAKKPRTASSKSSIHIAEKSGGTSRSATGIICAGVESPSCFTIGTPELKVPVVSQLGHIKKVLEVWLVEISPAMLRMFSDSTAKAATSVDSF